MLKIRNIGIAVALWCWMALLARADSTWEYSVQVSATVQTSPAQITLSWPQDTVGVPVSYTVYRKTLAATSWGTGTVLPGSTTTFVDNNVTVGSAYEYQIVKNASTYTGTGYIYAGVNAPLIESRGKLVLVVDSTYASQLTNELARLQQDLVGDGWIVLRHDVSRNDTVPNIKAVIQSEYNADPANVNAVFLFGHVPVPYSGDMAPDGHIPNHMGAWSADVYYGNMHGTWTDSSVNDTGADYDRNHNVPGDGKFDQSSIPGTVELMVGRVDLANMPGQLVWNGPATFPSELELLRNYLNKDHNFRMNQMNVPRRGVVGDYFGSRNGEAFAASGWRNFSTFFGAQNVVNLPNQGTWLQTLSTTPYLWAYGCGSGSFTSIGGIGTETYNDGYTTDLVNSNIQAVFTLLFGSWLGDFDAQDDIMRGVLATSSYGLTCAWSGRPHWFCQHMALGMPIGYSARLTQNNSASGMYQTQINSAAGGVHIALMGDPTLRMHTVAPVTSIAATANSGGVSVNWGASSDSIVGYNVYRSDSPNGPFTRLNSSLVTGTSYAASGSTSGTYMVRAVKLETSASGTYYNPSQGVFATVGTVITSTNTGSTGTNTTTSTNTDSSGGSTNVVTPVSTNGTYVLTNFFNWVDDAVPTGAQSGADGGDSWNWVSSNPTPVTGNAASQSSIGADEHQHYFSYASATMSVNSGDTLSAYVYLDPANPPSEIMLQWNDGTWEHRAYWGANSMAYGTDGTVSRQSMGALPATGQWVQLLVPATSVGLVGSTVNGMAFTQFGGRATWDAAGKGTLVQVSTPVTTTNSGSSTNVSTGGSSGGNSVLTNFVVWMDDALPTGAQAGSDGGDSWNWVSSNPAPFSGSSANQSSIGAGEHQHFFTYASSTMSVGASDTLAAYVYLDPANPPTEVMLQWNDGTWEHRAYWGGNSLTYGTDGTVSRQYMGSLPSAGQWAPLLVPASSVGLVGSTVNGMAFTLFGGRATFDAAGKGTLVQTTTPVTTTNNPGTNTTVTATNVITVTNFVNWVDDKLPTGAAGTSEGGDAWTWVSSNPLPFTGKSANQSKLVAGEHQHYFTGATSTLKVAKGDILVASVYLDATNTPSEVLLKWYNGSWEHRAYWGANSINMGTNGTAGRYYAGALPAKGQWVRLSVPASQVGLEGATLTGMGFSIYNGRATFDAAGKISLVQLTNVATSTNVPVTITNNPVTNPPPVTVTNTPSGTNGSATAMSAVDNITLRLPQPGDNGLRILSPNTLELVLINTKPADPATVTSWNFVNSSSQFTAPNASQLAVTVNGQPVSIQSIGFKRRPLYESPLNYDLRIENELYIQLSSSITDNQNVEVKNPDGTLWAASTQFTNTANPFRFNPAIHVNQEGYVPTLPKKAMIGYYLGSLGEMTVPASAGFLLVDSATGATVYQGTLTARPDTGWNTSPTPYQKVLMADFSNFKTPGEYQLVVPGYGASLPFLINDGIAMDFARAYALGLYGQRCGTNNAMPYSRFAHGACHVAPAQVPVPEANFAFSWTTIAGYSGGNTAQTAPQLVSDATSIFPFVNKGTIDVHGGHHDAGDYSKYTVNVASLIHYLMFAVDSLPNISTMDNLGIPESGDGIPDVLQEAKWEADYISRLQDADGAFYFIVYPQNREYESNVTPDHGDPQVVWPKNTVSTAAAVAALAQCASSPMMKKYYPADAAAYLAKAKLGWTALSNAIAKYGKTGAYQKITFYGDNFNDADELAWAACQMYLATGDQSIHQLLLSWFNPADPATWRWGWWHMSECYGHAIRSYAFAVQSGRAQANQLDATFLGKCKTEIAQAANDALTWSQQSSYGTSFPAPTKAVNSAGWYFGDDFGFDMAVGYTLNPSTNYLDGIVANMNYEGGCNPVNVTYVTGLGWKRERIIVSQMALNDGLTLPPSGMPIGNIQNYFPAFSYPNYGSEAENLCFPSDGATTGAYPFYDRWGDTWNVTTEMVGLNLARGLADLAFLAGQTAVNGAQAYTAHAGTIVLPTNITVNTPMTATFQAPAGMDLNGARIVWEAQFQEPAYGPTYTITPQYSTPVYIHAEAQWPDGRRAFATNVISAADSPLMVWVGNTLPGGATTGADGGDSWNWVGNNPVPYSGTLAHQSATIAGEHQHFFYGASGVLKVNTGDTLFTYVYLDPASPPTEIMLQWNDGTWEHRAYWGADSLGFGTDGNVSRVNMGALPATGKWVQLAIPASKVGLEGSTLNGMAFAAYGGHVTWDYSGKATAGTLIQ